MTRSSETGAAKAGQQADSAALTARARGWSDDMRRAHDDRLSDEQVSSGRAIASALATEIAVLLMAKVDPAFEADGILHGGILEHSGAVAQIVARIEEHRLCRLAAGADIRNQVEALVTSADAGLAASAEAFLVANARRTDAMGMPVLPVAELPPELRGWLVWDIAARLRNAYDAVDRGGIDFELSRAAHLVIAEMQDIRTVAGFAVLLAARLDGQGLLTDDMLLSALAEDVGPLFAAGLARRADVRPDTVWTAILDRTLVEFTCLADAAGLSPSVAARLSSLVATLNGMVTAQPPEISPDVRADVLRAWRTDPALTAALDRIARAIPPA